jgi:L-fuculose-phosphate aldolase
MDSEWRARRLIVQYARRMYERGLVAATDGNISARLAGDRLLVTPSGCCLGELAPDELLITDGKGRALSGRGRPTSESAIHAAVYAVRSDVHAVVHAHPPYANAFSFAGRELDACVIPEVVVGLGRVPTTPYATPSSPEGAAVVSELIRRHDALLLQRHGSVTVGADVRDAFLKLEKLEHAAQVLFLARQLGPVTPLSADELARLSGVAAHYGWRPPGFVQGQCPPPA